MGIFQELGVDTLTSGISNPLSGIGGGIINAGIFLIFAGILGVIGYLIYDWRVYKYKIVIFENLGGNQYVQTGVDRAKIVKLGDGGEQILKLKKRKELKSAYGKKMGKNTYWFAIGQDGYWYNIQLGDLDAKQGQLDIEPIDRDMRYMHVAIRKNIQDRYKKGNFMDKYGVLLINGLFLVIMLIGMWFIISEMNEMVGSLKSTQETSNNQLLQTQEQTRQIIASLDNIISSSGIQKTGG